MQTIAIEGNESEKVTHVNTRETEQHKKQTSKRKKERKINFVAFLVLKYTGEMCSLLSDMCVSLSLSLSLSYNFTVMLQSNVSPEFELLRVHQ